MGSRGWSGPVWSEIPSWEPDVRTGAAAPPSAGESFRTNAGDVGEPI